MTNSEAMRLEQSLHDLVTDGTLTIAQADRVKATVGAGRSEPAGSGRLGAMTEAAGYVGGALMLGGVSLLAPYLWDEISALGQLAAALAVALLLVTAALFAGHPRAGATLSPARRRLAGTLGALGAAAAGLAGVSVGELLHDQLFGAVLDEHVVLAGVAIAVTAAPLYLVFRGAPLLLMASCGGAIVVGEAGAAGDDYWTVGVPLLAYGALWLAVGILGVARESGAAGLLGSLTALTGTLCLLTERELAPVALLSSIAIAAACFLGFAWQQRWAFLAAGVVVALVGPTAAVAIWMSSELAAGSTLIGVGLALLGGGVVALRSVGPRGRLTGAPANRVTAQTPRG